MAEMLAIIGGRRTRDLLTGGSDCERFDPPETPFGPSQPIFKCATASGPFYFLSRHGGPESGQRRQLPFQVNYRANLYALRDLGVDAIVSWSSVQAVSHNFRIGQLVVPDDILDETRQIDASFLQGKGLGMLRSWPVFCPTIGEAIAGVLAERNLTPQHRATFVCTEGVRMHTPAEVKKYASLGGDLLGHWLAPEAFLAHELMMCYACLCFVSDYAETGSQYRPFEAGGLFAASEPRPEARADAAVKLFCELIPQLQSCLADLQPAGNDADCPCTEAMRRLKKEWDLPDDWRQWIS